jgi:glycosyltransferase involved in cell wall biosynthesis
VVGSIHILPENILAPFLRYGFYEMIRNLTWRYLIYFYNLTKWATVPTQTGAEMYKEKGLKIPITAISNGVDIEKFSPKNNGEYLRKRLNIPQKPVVLYSGRMNQEKNVDVLIRAIPLVLKDIDAHFLFCGSGGLKPELMRLTEELQVSDHTTFIDFLDWADYPNIYSLASIFVMPAESELQSIVTLEAIASGVPPIVVNKGAVPELVSNENGLLFEPKNSEQLAQDIVTILSDTQLRETMKKKSLQLSTQHSMSNVASQYEHVYTTVKKQSRS